MIPTSKVAGGQLPLKLQKEPCNLQSNVGKPDNTVAFSNGDPDLNSIVARKAFASVDPRAEYCEDKDEVVGSMAKVDRQHNRHPASQQL